MANVRGGPVLRGLQRLFGLGPVAGLSDREILTRYIEHGDEAAFESLVALHGAMVLGVCRRMLDDPGDVEDAFQATFLVLIRKARSVRPGEPVGPWLYGVAHRVALRARSEASRRRSREHHIDSIEAEAPAGGQGMSHASEIGPVLDGELSGLPASYRAAIILCYLEGRTHEEAARQLGWPVGTLKGRLARAKEMLRGRLARRGVAPTSGALAVFLTREAGASVPTGWVEISVRAAKRAAEGETFAGVVSASAVALSEGVLRAMKLQALKMASATFAMVLMVVAGAGAFTQQPYQPAQTKKVAGVPNPPAETQKVSVVPNPGGPPPGPRRPSIAAQTKAIQSQLNERLTMSFPQETPLEDFLKYIKSSTQSEELDLPSGIPIYVDPDALRDAEMTMTSPISIDLEGVPLHRTLSLALKQLGLKYYLVDGMMLISSPDADEDLIGENAPNGQPSPLKLMKAKAERGELDAAQRKEFIQMLKDLNAIRKELHEFHSSRLSHTGPHQSPSASQQPSATSNAPNPGAGSSVPK
jgi:RNA polymerase sigma factor (sigma-70 family)